jgi:hypothetical protein
MEGEHIVGIVYGAEGQVGRLSLPKMYDLVFTDRRLVGVATAKTGAATIVGGVLGGAIGGAIAHSIAKAGQDEKRVRYSNRRLDEIIQSDNANFAAPYGEAVNPRIKGLFSKYLELRVEGKKAVFKLPKEQLATAQSLARNLGQRL